MISWLLYENHYCWVLNKNLTVVFSPQRILKQNHLTMLPLVTTFRFKQQNLFWGHHLQVTLKSEPWKANAWNVFCTWLSKTTWLLLSWNEGLPNTGKYPPLAWKKSGQTTHKLNKIYFVLSVTLVNCLTVMCRCHWWATQVAKHAPNLCNQHNNRSDFCFDRYAALCLTLY